MLRTARIVGAILPIGLGLALAWTGCAQVLSIEDWQQGTGGQGGEGGRQTSSGSTMTTSNGSTMTTSNGSTSSSSGMQVTAVSASAAAGTGGQGNGCDGLCVSPPPMGWEGYVAAYMANKDDALPACDAQWPGQMDWKTGTLVAPPATCGDCNCSAPAGGHCNLTQVSIGIYADASCGPATASTSVTGTSCIGVNTGGLTTFHAKLVGQSLPSNSLCMATGLPPVIEPAYFDKHARMCGAPPSVSSCMDGRQCVPLPPDQFPTLCIYQTVPNSSTVSCPTGFNPAPDFYTDIMDNRNCSACTCYPPVGQTCELSAQIFANGTCMAGTGSTMLSPGMCSGGLITNGYASALVSPGMPKNGSCNPSTPNPTGAASGTGRTVVCCLP